MRLRDPRIEPRQGDVAIRKRGAKSVTVIEVLRHLNSTDISYIRVRADDTQRQKSIIVMEWQQNYCDHRVGDQDVALTNCIFIAADHTWVIDTLTLTRCPDGTLGASMAELKRIHVIIADRIRAQGGPKTPGELEFFTDIGADP